MLRSGDKEGTSLMHRVQPREVQIAQIHDVEGPGFEGQNIEHIDIAQLAVADVNEAGNGATQIKQRVQLDRRLGRAKRRPIDNRFKLKVHHLTHFLASIPSSYVTFLLRGFRMTGLLSMGCLSWCVGVPARHYWRAVQ